MKIKKQKTETCEYNLNFLLNKRNKLYEKLSNYNNRIKSANPNTIKQDNDHHYFTQYKKHKNKLVLNPKSQLSNIKCISFKKLFNFNESKNNDIVNDNKNKFPKLFLLKNTKDNNYNYNVYNSIIHSSRNNKYTRNYPFMDKNLSANIARNKNRRYNQTSKEFYISNNDINNINNINKNKSQNDFFKSNISIINNIDKNNNKKIVKNYKHFCSTDKICTTSNCCDASTNTLALVSLKNLKNLKKYKRPLMIDYFYSEHKKFCYGFDKLKGKNKYKKPFFIVHKY